MKFYKLDKGIDIPWQNVKDNVSDEIDLAVTYVNDRAYNFEVLTSVIIDTFK